MKGADKLEIKGIDVSSYQGNPDWSKVSNSGVKFAILRIHQKSGIDESFEHNYKGCKSNGILIGGYKYSYALTSAQAIEEAENVISVLGGRGLDFPVFYDLEWAQQRSLGKQAIENIAVAFLTRIKKAGYKDGIYCNLDWYNNVLTDALKQYDCWIARYPASDNGSVQERLRPNAGVGWQYSSKGKVDGINGNVDMNVFYKDYRDSVQKGETAVAKTKLQEFIELGDYYANNGGNKPYLEKSTNAYLDDFQRNAGYNNYTKFARDVNSWGQPGCQGQPWCAEYQFWKLVKVLGITKALQIMGSGFYNCVSITNWAKKKGTWRNTPKVGALVIFRNGSHIGSVQSFDEARIYTNEGNTSSAPGVVANGGAVRNKSYAINDSSIDGYVWIDWDETVQETWKKAGTRVATVNDLYVRETPNGYVMGSINKGTVVEIDGKTSGKWTHVKVSGIGIGWIWTGYLAKEGGSTSATITGKQDKTQVLFKGNVTATVLNVRTWAGTEYPNIKKYPKLNQGNEVEVMNYTQKDKNGSKWYYVRIAGKYYGFVSAKYIKKQ